MLNPMRVRWIIGFRINHKNIGAVVVPPLIFAVAYHYATVY